MKVWVTKYWDTRGVYEADTRDAFDSQYVYVKEGPHLRLMRLGSGCFEVRADAIANARGRAVRRMQLLDLQMTKVRKLAEEFGAMEEEALRP